MLCIDSRSCLRIKLADNPSISLLKALHLRHFITRVTPATCSTRGRMDSQGRRLLLILLLLCGGCCNHLCHSHANQLQDQEHADYGFSETTTTDNVKPDMEGRPTVVRQPHGYIGVGSSDQITPSPNNYWRVLCNPQHEIFIVLMGMHLAPQSYFQIKTTRFEGCTDKFHTRHFHKKSVLAAFVSNSAVLSAFKMAYVCVATDKHMLASNTLENRAALDYFATREDSLDLFLQFLNNPGMILSHGTELQKIFELSKQANQEGGEIEMEMSGESNLSTENLTGDDVE